MALLAFNLTTSPVAIPGASPAVTLSASATAGTPGPSHNVTAQLQGLTGPQYATIDALRKSETISLLWTDRIEYDTATLQVSSPTIDGRIDRIIYANPTGNDSNPGTLAAPVQSADAAFALLQSDWARAQVVAFAPGTYNWNQPVLNFGGANGSRAADLILQGGFTNELGTRAATAGSGASTVIDSSLGATIRSGSAASFTTGAAAGTIRLTGLTGMTSADVDRALMIRRGASAANNGCFTITNFVSATSVDVRNSQGVTGDANNGGIYWQESFEGNTLAFFSGTAKGQRRLIADHGVEATGTINCVAVASLVDNDNFFIPDGVGAGVTFEYHVTGGFVPVGGRVEINVSALTTAAEVALATRNAINAQTVAALKVRATSSAGTSQVQLKHMDLGTVGNVTVTEAVANAGFTVTGLTGGVGNPLNTFTLVTALSPTPAVSDTFNVEKPSVIINYNSPATTGRAAGQSASIIHGHGNVCLIRGIKFVATGGTNLTMSNTKLLLEGAEFQLRGTNFFPIQGNGASMFVSIAAASSEFNNLLDILSFGSLPDVLGGDVTAATNDPTKRPFVLGLLPTTAQCGATFRDGSLTFNNTAAIGGIFSFRNVNVDADPDCVLRFTAADAKRTTFQVRGWLTFTGASRLDGQFRSNEPAIIHMDKNAYLTVSAALIVNNALGDAIRIAEDSGADFSAALSGTGNVGYGINAISASKVIVPTGVTVTGALGDAKVGLLAVRSWSGASDGFYTVAPIGNQLDYKGDASRIATAATTAPMP